MIGYLDNEKVLFLGFYTNRQSLYHELGNTLYMYICMCIYIYIYMCICIRVRVSVQVWVQNPKIRIYHEIQITEEFTRNIDIDILNKVRAPAAVHTSSARNVKPVRAIAWSIA